MDAAYVIVGGAMSKPMHAQETCTFVVRMRRENDGKGEDHWRGRVENVALQEVGYVEGVAGVAHFIERWTGPDGEVMPALDIGQDGTYLDLDLDLGQAPDVRRAGRPMHKIGGS